MLHKATLIVSFMILLSVCISLESTDSSTNSSLDGKSLYNMGKSLNYPLLKLLGRTFEALEEEIAKDTDNKTSFLLDTICRLHVCTEWTSWSNCSIALRGYGAQTRSRQCATNDKSLCANKVQRKNETDVRICEGSCPSNYTVTENGFCIGFYRQIMNINDAKAFCKGDGGYLVNIDSEMKASDINKLLDEAKMTSSGFIIDGQRSLPNGSWRYDYGHASGYSNWASGNPSSSADCKYLIRRSGVWYINGMSCTTGFLPLCEIIMP